MAETDSDLRSPRGPLFLIDGNSLAYRAYFALPESMATSDGRPTNAIYGFAQMMVKVLTEHRPGAVVVAWDAGLSGRETIYPEYKAGRSSRPDLLREQWPAFEPLSSAFGFTNLRAEGFEADDVIATVSDRARRAGIEVMVVSGDRDVYQLIGDGVRVMTTSRGVTEVKIYDSEAVIERWGVPPELVPDLIGLKGDSSDNIPGVPGVGEKTAADLLSRFGSLEAVLSSIDQISGAKRKQNLTEHADDARLSMRLATANRAVPIEIDLDVVMAAEPDRGGLREFAAEYEMRQVIARLEQDFDEELPDREVDRALSAELEEDGSPSDLSEPLALAVDPDGWALADQERIVGARSSLRSIEPLLGRAVAVHDAKSLDLPGLEVGHDTMIAAYLIDPARRDYTLEDLAVDHGIIVAGAEPTGADAAGQLSLDGAESAVGIEPAARARLTWALAAEQRRQLAELGLERLMAEVELPLIEVLRAIEAAGIRLDVERLAQIGRSIEGEADRLKDAIYADAGREFTIGSPQQLGEVLFEELALTRKRRGKTGFSTDARVLAQIRGEHPIVEKIERWRELTKLKNTYLDALPDYVNPATGRIHTSFSQVRAATGRLSSTNPNLQNIPVRTELGRPVRGCFVAEPGMHLLSCDYNQVELRVLAHVAEETALREIFASGLDVHSATAAEIVGADPDAISAAERSKAKMVNYGIAYGLSAFGLAERLQIGRNQAASFIDAYFERFPAVKQFIDATIEQARQQGYVTTLLGRRRRIPELQSSRSQIRSQGERLAVNTVIQGTAADIIKLAMIRCHRALAEGGFKTRLILQIHDELLFECSPEELEAATELARREMTTAYPLDPPLLIDCGSGPDWLSAK